MKKYSNIFNYACRNDVKALNNVIENEGRRYHATYMTDMMFVNDINNNYRLFLEIRDTINNLYSVISENYLLKKRARDVIGSYYYRKLSIQKEWSDLTDQQMFYVVYCQALEYYFRIDIGNESDFSSYFDEALQYRITSDFFHSELECILLKIGEDAEIVIQETKNLAFLLRILKRIDKTNDAYKMILKLLVDCIQNEILQDDEISENYFVTTKKINLIIQSKFGEKM